VGCATLRGGSQKGGSRGGGGKRVLYSDRERKENSPFGRVGNVKRKAQPTKIEKPDERHRALMRGEKRPSAGEKRRRKGGGNHRKSTKTKGSPGGKEKHLHSKNKYPPLGEKKERGSQSEKWGGGRQGTSGV